jgi:hypothetical protein
VNFGGKFTRVWVGVFFMGMGEGGLWGMGYICRVVSTDNGQRTTDQPVGWTTDNGQLKVESWAACAMGGGFLVGSCGEL